MSEVVYYDIGYRNLILLIGFEGNWESHDNLNIAALLKFICSNFLNFTDSYSVTQLTLLNQVFEIKETLIVRKLNACFSEAISHSKWHLHINSVVYIDSLR
jgi:hypothetical protein